LEEKLEERPKTEVPPKRERTAEEYLSSISGPPTLQNLFQYCEMRFGFKEGQASSIADYAATTGGPNAFKNPATLLTKMNEFGNIGNPSLRKVIIDFYLQKASIQPTSEYEEKAGLLPGEAKRLNETKKEAERNFAFDPSSGTIRQAMENERGITIAEAEMLKGKWLVDHPNAKGGDDKIPKVIYDENGVAHPNPNAQMSPYEVRGIDAMNQPGELSQILQNEDLKERASKIFGKGEEKKGAIFGMSIEEFTAIRTLFTPPVDPEIKEILKKLAEGGAKTEDPALTLIKAQLEEQKKQTELMRQKMDEEREARHKSELERRDAQAAELNKKVEELAKTRTTGSKDVPDLISEGFAGLKEEAHAIGAHFGPALASKLNGPGTLPTDQKKIIIAGIKEAAKGGANSPAMNELRQLVKEIP
jgi:hypothetical protein